MYKFQSIFHALQQKKIFLSRVFVGVLISVGFGVIFINQNAHNVPSKTETVLGIVVTPTPTPEPTPTPSIAPTAPFRRTVLQTPTTIPFTPTPTPIINSNTASPTNTPTPTSQSSPTDVPPTPSPTFTPTPTATPSGIAIEVSIDYAGQKDQELFNTHIDAGQNAWEAVKKAVGIENIQYTDYGGDMGIFITGFHGIVAASNQYYEFRVNGVSSSVGVSSFVCENADKLAFVLVTF